MPKVTIEFDVDDTHMKDRRSMSLVQQIGSGKYPNNAPEPFTINWSGLSFEVWFDGGRKATVDCRSLIEAIIPLAYASKPKEGEPK